MNHQTTINFDTRKEALESVRDRISALQSDCMNCLSGENMTADEIAAMLGLSPLYIRPRVAELKAKGKIVDTGVRRANKSGKKAIVWALNSK